MQYVNLYQQFGSSNLIGWKFEKGMASLFSRTMVNIDLAVVALWEKGSFFFIAER